MATERQIAANQRNSARSSGPKSASGKARSAKNATKHGLAGVLAEAEADLSPQFLERRANWAAEHRPGGDTGHWALDRAVAATFRIEHCERAFDVVIAAARQRAALAWSEDREVEAATVFGRLARDPVLASRQLRAGLAGVGLLIEAWLGLVAALEKADWSEAEQSRALDLLGVASDLRSGRTLIEPVDGADSASSRRELAIEEVERLEALRDESMAPLDEMDRRQALAGDVAMFSKPARLVLRYERDAWRRYNQAMKEVRDSAESPTIVPAAPPPTRVAEVVRESAPPLAPAPPTGPRPETANGARSRVAAPASEASSTTFERERRELQAAFAPYREVVIAQLRAEGFEDEDAWVAELERRVEAGPGGRLATDRSQFRGEPVGSGAR
jgi:hypothetical protein